MDTKFKHSAQRCREKLVNLENKKRKIIHLPDADIQPEKGGKYLRVVEKNTLIQPQEQLTLRQLLLQQPVTQQINTTKQHFIPQTLQKQQHAIKPKQQQKSKVNQHMSIKQQTPQQPQQQLTIRQLLLQQQQTIPQTLQKQEHVTQQTLQEQQHAIQPQQHAIQPQQHAIQPQQHAIQPQQHAIQPQQPLPQQQHATQPPQQSLQQNAKQQPQSKQQTTLSTSADKIICRYPDKPKGYTVHGYDLACLEEGQWLNDSVVNYVLAWAQGETIGEFRNQVRICDSQWFTRIIRGGFEIENILHNVRQTEKWFPPTGHPFDNTVVVVPICVEDHWIAVVAIQRDRELSLVVMDSMKSTRVMKVRTVLNVVLEYCRPGVTKHWYDADVSHQTNFVDCGVHLISNTIRILQHLASGIYKDLVDIEEQMNKPKTHIGRGDIRILINAAA